MGINPFLQQEERDNQPINRWHVVVFLVLCALERTEGVCQTILSSHGVIITEEGR